MENWKDIKGFEGLYQVSDNGRVKSLDRYRKGKRGALTICKGRILSPHKGKNGYIQICLCKENHKYTPLVHRLVGEAFIPNKDNLPCIDHIDGNRENNSADNLRWCTTKENMSYSLVKNRISAVQKSNERCRQHQRDIQSACRKPIVAVFPNGKIKEYSSVIEAEKDGFSHSNISAVCRNRQKSHRGCKFYYKKDYYSGKT